MAEGELRTLYVRDEHILRAEEVKYDASVKALEAEIERASSLLGVPAAVPGVTENTTNVVSQSVQWAQQNPMWTAFLGLAVVLAVTGLVLGLVYGLYSVHKSSPISPSPSHPIPSTPWISVTITPTRPEDWTWVRTQTLETPPQQQTLQVFYFSEEDNLGLATYDNAAGANNTVVTVTRDANQQYVLGNQTLVITVNQLFVTAGISVCRLGPKNYIFVVNGNSWGVSPNLFWYVSVWQYQASGFSESPLQTINTNVPFFNLSPVPAYFGQLSNGSIYLIVAVNTGNSITGMNTYAYNSVTRNFTAAGQITAATLSLPSTSAINSFGVSGDWLAVNANTGASRVVFNMYKFNLTLTRFDVQQQLSTYTDTTIPTTFDLNGDFVVLGQSSFNESKTMQAYWHHNGTWVTYGSPVETVTGDMSVSLTISEQGDVLVLTTLRTKNRNPLDPANTNHVFFYDMHPDTLEWTLDATTGVPFGVFLPPGVLVSTVEHQDWFFFNTGFDPALTSSTQIWMRQRTS